MGLDMTILLHMKLDSAKWPHSLPCISAST